MSERALDRRDLLKNLGLAATGGAVLSACQDEEDPFALTKPHVPGTDSWLEGEERFVSTACAQCPAGCGIRVRVVEGRAVKIEGNTACPVNRGGIGPRGLSGLQTLYDPDRVRQPLIRRGPRGSGSLEPIAWDDALAIVAQRLKDLRAKGEAQRVAIVCGKERGLTLELWQRFAAAFGTPNFYDGFALANGPVLAAVQRMQGIRDVPAYDWARTHYVLSLGSGVLESSCQLVYFARAQVGMRRGPTGLRAKIVHVGVAMTRTAMNADEWLRVRPGTYAAFALALAHVLVRDGLHDADFVRDHGFGFERWKDAQGVEHAGFRDLLKDYAPDKAAAICGVRAADLERIAKEMATLRPSFAIAGADELLASNGLPTAMAVHALNALLGAIDRPGGLLVQRAAPLATWPELELDDVAEKSREHPRLDGAGHGRFPLAEAAIDALPDALAEGKPYALDTLLLHYSNPLYSRPNPARWRAALDRIPFIVTFSPFLDETASDVADLVLPDHTYLERWEDASGAPSIGTAVFTLRQPAVEPQLATRHTGDVVIQIAKAVGEPLDAAFAFEDFRDALKKRVIGLWKAQRGSIVEKEGSAFLKRLYAEGFWSDDAYPFGQWDEVLKTSSGRFEFFSQSILHSLEEAVKGGRLKADNVDRLCLPRHEEIVWRGDVARFPHVLILYKPNTYAVGSGANLPWLQELPDPTGRPIWTTEAEVHPETAALAGVRSGDTIEVESPIGVVRVRAHVTDGILPGVIRIPEGGGHTAFGRFARGWGANPLCLVDAGGMDSLSGVPAHCSTRVAIRKVTA